LHVNLAVVGGRSAKAATIQGNVAEYLRIFVIRFDNVEPAFGSGLTCFPALACRIIENWHVKLAIRKQWAGVALLDSKLQFPQDVTRVSVHGAKVALLADDINAVADKNRRSRRRAEFVGP